MALEHLGLAGAAGVDVADGHDLGRAAAARLGRERLRPDGARGTAPSPSNSVSTSVLPPKIAVPTIDRVAVDLAASMPLVSTGRSSFADRRRERVAAVVALREQDQRRAVLGPTSVASAAAPTTPGERVAGVDGVHLGRAVLAERRRDASASAPT